LEFNVPFQHKYGYIRDNKYNKNNSASNSTISGKREPMEITTADFLHAECTFLPYMTTIKKTRGLTLHLVVEVTFVSGNFGTTQVNLNPRNSRRVSSIEQLGLCS